MNKEIKQKATASQSMMAERQLHAGSTILLHKALKRRAATTQHGVTHLKEVFQI